MLALIILISIILNVKIDFIFLLKNMELQKGIEIDWFEINFSEIQDYMDFKSLPPEVEVYFKNNFYKFKLWSIPDYSDNDDMKKRFKELSLTSNTLSHNESIELQYLQHIRTADFRRDNYIASKSWCTPGVQEPKVYQRKQLIKCICSWYRAWYDSGLLK